jgi:hypothetical protein
VVHVLGEAGFLPSQDFEAVATALRALALEFVSQSPMPVVYMLDCFAVVDLPIAIDRDVGHAQIDTQNTLNIDQIGIFNIDCGKQIPVATHKRQVGFAAW